MCLYKSEDSKFVCHRDDNDSYLVDNFEPCQKKFPTELALTRHIKATHSEHPGVTCPCRVTHYGIPDIVKHALECPEAEAEEAMWKAGLFFVSPSGEPTQHVRKCLCLDVGSCMLVIQSFALL